VWTHAAGTIEIDFQIFLDRLKSIGANVEKIRQTADVLGTFPNLRAQVIGNPVTGEAYLLLDAPANPPAPMALGFTPDRAHSVDANDVVVDAGSAAGGPERAETTLRVLGEIVSRIPGSLDRSDRFFANVERIVQRATAGLSADSRKFFATSGAQIERIASEMEGVVGTRGTLTTFVDERAPQSKRPISSHESVRTRRGGPGHARG
jgi:hypothetical protein